MKKWFLICFIAFLSVVAFAQFSPFKAEIVLSDNQLPNQLSVKVIIPEGHKLYEDSFAVTDSTGKSLKPIRMPLSVVEVDDFSDEERAVFKESFVAVYEVDNADDVQVSLFGCSDVACFPPDRVTLSQTDLTEVVDANVESDVVANLEEANSDWRILADEFEISRTGIGFMNVSDFSKFLSGSEESDGFLKSPVEFFKKFGWWMTAVLVLLGGLALNLTPCVLPMIPINIAIIGAGSQAGSKKRGALLGAVYGLGIALTYGALGLILVITGSSFGSINSSPWFNFIIALIFVALSLAMFDVLSIDLSRFQRTSGETKKNGGFIVAISMGAVVALLAGACVAPVVIAVLILSGNLYASGSQMGLLLPFILGLGMALPWPFVGAGLSILPKPGVWMNIVKKVFGVLILAMAVYYASLGFSIMNQSKNSNSEVGDSLSLEAGLQKALDENKPVLIDFWATWCKNCMTMKKTTLKDFAIKAELEDFVFIEYQAENPNDPEIAEVMKRFGVRGLPTFIILEKNK